MKNHKLQKGLTGIEVAIILIVFIVVCSILVYILLEGKKLIEHERTPGKVAVMCPWPKGIAGGAHPLLCPTRQNDSTHRLISQYRASDGRFSGFPAK
jgi:flagellin-like protein